MADSLLAALEELNEQELRASEYASDAVLVIDNDLRTIAVPSNFIFGVYNDKNVLSVNFEMPRTYDDVDLSDFTIQINYLAPNKVGNIYEVAEPVIGEDKITFEWLLDRGVFLSSGTVEFTVCLREIGQEGAIIREFNTTIAKGTVLAGLEIEDPEDPEAYSLIAHIKQMDERVTSQAATVAADYAKVARMADEIEATAEELADDVAEVKEKYGSPLVAPTAAGMIDHTRIYVYTGNETGYTFGNWYYYDGSAWTSGGVYNSAGVNTDATLSVSGMAADAKKTGDEISELKEDLSDITEDGSETVHIEKSALTKLSAYIMPTQHQIDTNGNTRLVYFECLPNTEYTVNKVLSARFRVGYSTALPAEDAVVYGYVADNAATSLTLITGSDARYGVVYYYDGANDSLSENEIYESLDITYVDDLGITAIDKVARKAITDIGTGLSDEVKEALLSCFRHIAWMDDQGPTYYNALESALYAGQYPKIMVAFNPGLNTIYTDDTLDSLKQYLTVKYFETGESAGTVIPSANYNLSGALVEGSNTIYVTYNDLAASFVVNGVVDFYNTWAWSLADGNIAKVVASCDTDANAVTGAKIGYTEQRPTQAPRRRTTVTKHGNLPYTIYGTSDLSEDYPVPIPKTATKIKVTITPNTQYSYINIIKLDSTSGKYLNYVDSVKGWTQGINEKSFTASENLFAEINYKYDSAGESYPTEPSAISIEFSEV